ncbi:MAG: chemotaxis protein [Desulfobacteraceae bacterium]|nr:MAG: chemotaxis protein [Desulfobacteraceae bacterium]
MENQKRVVRRHKKHEEHGGSHGSWKVAYADFVTAMMAFFLLMWLLTMSSNEQRARIANYFKTFSIFEKGGSSFMEFSSEMVTKFNMIEDELGGADPNQPKRGEESPMNPVTPRNVVEDLTKKELQERLQNDIGQKLGEEAGAQVKVEMFEGGLRIQLMDTEGSPMFHVGSSTLTSKAKEILKVITEQVKGFTGKTAIEGHTDARAYPSEEYTNWELSTERALAARKEMGRNGLNISRLIRVAGFADTEPLIKDDPYDLRNRRISILLFSSTSKKEAKDPITTYLLNKPAPGVNTSLPVTNPETQP